jgi:hypothetical protein
VKRKNVTATALAIFGTATVAAVTACSSPAPLSLGQQIAPGSAAVPCSAIAGQLSYLARYPIYSVEVITNGFPAGFYARELRLANMFNNVSNADNPLALSGAEVDYESAVTSGQGGPGGQAPSVQEPVTGDVAAAFVELEQACGLE